MGSSRGRNSRSTGSLEDRRAAAGLPFCAARATCWRNNAKFSLDCATSERPILAERPREETESRLFTFMAPFTFTSTSTFTTTGAIELPLVIGGVAGVVTAHHKTSRRRRRWALQVTHKLSSVAAARRRVSRSGRSAAWEPIWRPGELDPRSARALSLSLAESALTAASATATAVPSGRLYGAANATLEGARIE